MSSRPFQCTPAAWNRDPVLNSVSWEAEFLFRRISLECDRYWRMAVDGAEIAHSVRCRVLEPMSRYRAWQENKVARCLDELRAAGIVILLCQGGHSWLQIADWLHYVKGSSGDIVPERAEQEDLALPGELFVVESREKYFRGSGVSPPALRAPGRLALPLPSHCNERTSREDENRTSTRQTIDHTRSRSRHEEELLGEIAGVIGDKEIAKNGGIWRLRIRNSRRALLYALEDYKLRGSNPHNAPIKNRGAWLTDRYLRAIIETEKANHRAG